MIGSEQQHGQVAQHSEQNSGRIVTDQSELHEPYTDDERFFETEHAEPSGPVSTQFEFPDQA